MFYFKKYYYKYSSFISRKDKINDILTKSFSPSYIEVINESFKHNVPKDFETHFKVIIVSEHFRNKSVIEIHKGIYKLLTNEMGEKKENKLHALSLVTKTPEEWNKINQLDNSKTPNCMGGDKK